MQFIDLEPGEISLCEELIQKLQTKYETACTFEFLQDVALYASQLPKRIRLQFRDLKYNPSDNGQVIVRGFPIEDVGPTPSNWNYPESYHPNLKIDYFSILLSSLVGEVFGWETQQKGKLIHDLIPIEGKESAQTGYGSTSELVMHTEDSFHKYRGDYISFYCIRNTACVPTTFASVVDLDLSDEVKKILFQKRFFIMPDDSHLDKEQTESGVSEQYIQALCDEKHRVALLYGNFEKPHLCFDPHYTVSVHHDEETRRALDILIAEVNNHTFDYSLSPGDICILDNRKMIHGRRAFEATHDGNDRWLKRINITSCLRKSADSRVTRKSRIIGEAKSLALEN